MKQSALSYLLCTTKDRPNHIAIKEGDRTLTFWQLAGHAGKLSQALRETLGSAGFGKPIAILVPRSTEALVAFAGVLAIGAIYVPIDISAPEVRIQSILDDLEPSAIICCRAHGDLLALCEQVSAPVLWIDDAMKGSASLTLDEGVVDTDPCYIMFTSGSTGKPKGVVVPHRGVIDYIDWALNSLGPACDDIIGSQAPFFFDNSTLDIYLSWAVGAALDIIPTQTFVFPDSLAQYLSSRGITWIFFVPSVLRVLATSDALKDGAFNLRMVAFAGEVMPTSTLRYLQGKLPDARFVNLYGPTEITVDCTWFEVDRSYSDDEALPIGWPCRNTDVLLLNDMNKLCADGELGEICVRGSSLALGYYNNPKSTDLSFVQNPLRPQWHDRLYRTGDLAYRRSDGALMYQGRKDNQIKHRGYRIELGDIEAAADGLMGVMASAALYDRASETLALAIEAKQNWLQVDLRRALAVKLPKYMLPRLIRQISKMPMTANGKVDRTALSKTLFDRAKELT